jgi:hypothetical protein
MYGASRTNSHQISHREVTHEEIEYKVSLMTFQLHLMTGFEHSISFVSVPTKAS